jgi:predicted nucleotidyltransferase
MIVRKGFRPDPDSDWDVVLLLDDDADEAAERRVLTDPALPACLTTYLDLFLLRPDGEWHCRLRPPSVSVSGG